MPAAHDQHPAPVVTGGGKAAVALDDASAVRPVSLHALLDLVLSSLDYESALTAVAKLSLPQFGAWSIVDVVERADSMRRLAIIHPDPGKQELARALPSCWPPETEDPIGAPVVMRTRSPHVVDDVNDEMLVKFARSPGNLAALRELGIRSYVVWPLIAQGEVLGAVTFVNDQPGYKYTDHDLAEAEEMAALIALVIHNAKLHRDTGRARERADRAAEQARQQQRDLERVMEIQSRLVRGFSHDVKNPLGAAMGYADLLNSGLKGGLTPEQMASTQRICSSLQTAFDLIEDLVAYASRKMEKLDIRPVVTDVRELVQEISDEYRAQVEGAGLALEVDVSAEVPLIWTDRIRIRQILGNLMSNAVKYTDAGSVRVSAEIRPNPRSADGKDSVALHVSDTGRGIPPDKQDLLFQEFARLEPATTAGAGLGLAISLSIATALGGDITVESTQGQGSTFTLWLPLLTAREEDRKSAA